MDFALLENQGQHLALTVVYVPYSLDSRWSNAGLFSIHWLETA